MSNPENNASRCSHHGPYAVCGHTDATCPEILQNGTFADSLMPSDLDARTPSKNLAKEKIWEVGGRPEILVRERVIAPDEDSEKLMDSMSKAQELFARMRATYGISIVSAELLGGENADGRPAIYTVVDKIEGKNVTDTEHLPDTAKDALDALYVSLARYYDDARKQGGAYWGDCNNTQFVYGRKKDEEDAHFYLVDIGPEFYTPGQSEHFPISWPILQMCRGLVEAEKKFTPVAHLQTARETLLSTIEEMLKDGSINVKPLLEAKNLLERANA